MVKATEASCIAITLWCSWSVSPRSTWRVAACAACCLPSTVATKPSSMSPKPFAGGSASGAAGPIGIFGSGASGRASGVAEKALMEPMFMAMGLLADLERLHGHLPCVLHHGEVRLVGARRGDQVHHFVGEIHIRHGHGAIGSRVGML